LIELGFRTINFVVWTALLLVGCVGVYWEILGEDFEKHLDNQAVEFIWQCGTECQIRKWGELKFGAPAVIRYHFLEGKVPAEKMNVSALCDDNLKPMQTGLWGGSISQAAFEQEVVRAMAQWSAVAQVDFVRSESVQDADLLIGFALRNPSFPMSLFSGVTLAGVGFKSAPERTKTFQKNKVSVLCFSEDIRWHDGLGSSVLFSMSSVYPVALHEMGHVLGLAHISYGQSIMRHDSKYMSSGLAKVDIEGVRYLYGARK
jgi:hypothetical protein